MAAITPRHRLFAVVAGGSVDREAEAELRAAAEAKGGHVVRTTIGNSDPTKHFIDYVIPQLERLRSSEPRPGASLDQAGNTCWSPRSDPLA
jgi:hypothetical protein